MADANSRPYGLIYLVTNTVNGKVYVGQTTLTLIQRWRRHCNTKQRMQLRFAISKYGRDAFRIEQIGTAWSKDELDALEIATIAQYRSTENERGYNVAPGGGGTGKRSRESVERGAAKLRGKPLSEELRAKISAAKTGKKQTPEHIENMRQSKLGYRHTAEARAKMSAALTGKKKGAPSEALKKKLAEATRRYWASAASAEQRAARSEKAQQRKISAS